MLDKIVFQIRNKNIYRLYFLNFDIIGINQFEIIIYFRIEILFKIFI